MLLAGHFFIIEFIINVQMLLDTLQIVKRVRITSLDGMKNGNLQQIAEEIESHT